MISPDPAQDTVSNNIPRPWFAAAADDKAPAAMIPGFTPTRHELCQLARIWFREIIRLNSVFLDPQRTLGSEIQLDPNAISRLTQMSQALGTEELAAVLDEVLEQESEGGPGVRWSTIREDQEREVLAECMADEQADRFERLRAWDL